MKATNKSILTKPERKATTYAEQLPARVLEDSYIEITLSKGQPNFKAFLIKSTN